MTEQINHSPLLRWLVPLSAAFVTGTAFAYFLDFSTTNIFSIIFLILLYPLYRNALQTKYDWKIKMASRYCGVFFMLSLWLRKLACYYYDEDPQLNKNISMIIGFYLFFTAITANLYEKIKSMDWNTAKSQPSKKKTVLIFFGSLVLMVLAWLPYFLYLYPGEVTADSISELNQAEGNEALSNHHPIAHTFMIKIFFELGLKLFGNDNAALATYSICQSILLAASFAYLIITLYQFGFRKIVIGAIFLLYALLPYHASYSFTMWKDIWFGGIMLAFGVTLWRLFVWYGLPGKEKKLPVFELVMTGILGIGVCLFRSNGLYAYVFFLLFFLLYHISKKRFIPVIVCTGSLIIAMIIKVPVYNALNVTPPDTIESLSIPAQHIAAAIRDYKSLTPEEYELLSQVVDVQKIPERYVADISDSIKNLVRETDNQEYIDEHKFEFLKLWISLGFRYPDSYLFAQINQTFGYFYPDVQYWVYPSEFRGENFEIFKDRKLSQESSYWIEAVRELYRFDHYLGMFYSIGLMTWITLFMFGAAFMKKSTKFLLIYLPAIGVILTLMIATPVFAEFRYAYCMFTSVPLFCCIPFLNVSALNQKEDIPSAEPEEVI